MASIKSYKKNGKTFYKFNLYLGMDPVTNKKITTTRRGFKTSSEAKAAIRTLQTEFAEKGWKSSNSTDIKTFQQLFDAWFENYQLSVK